MRPRHRTFLKRSTLFAATAALIAGPLAAMPTASAAPEDEVTITFLGINDFHGRIDENTVKFAGTIEQLRAAAGEDNTVFVAAGDNIGASLFASAQDQDNPTIDVLKALQLDNSAVGNHEFDQGFADLTTRVIPRMGQNRFGTDVFLGANVYDKGTEDPALPEYAEYTVAGVDVAVIGVVTEETHTLVSPAGIADLDFGDPVDAVNRVATELKDGDDTNGEADVVIASYHEGAPIPWPADGTQPPLEDQVAASPVFAKMTNETSAQVDAIFTGHTHQRYAYAAPVPGDPSKTRPLVQSGNYGEGVAKVELTYDTATDEVMATTQEVVARTADSDDDLVAEYPRVAEVKTIVDAALEAAAEIGNQPVGTITEDITTALIGGTYEDGKYFHPTPDANGVRDDRGSESTLGNLVANTLRESLASEQGGNAEIGVVNPGGLRAELLYPGNTSSNPANTDGVVTFAEANAVLPFVNNLWSVTLTGEQFVTMLEQQWQRNADGTVPSRAYLQLGLSDNVSYTFHEVDDPANAGAKKGVIDSVTIDGAPIDLEKDYRIGTFSFLATGGDNFHVFTEGAAPKDSGLIDRDAWIDYLGANEDLAPSFARRAVKLDAAAPTNLAPGAPGSVTLPRLNLTSLGSPANTEVTATLDGNDLGPFPVTDGSATVDFTAPTAPGTYDLVVAAAPSGTEAHVPVTVEAPPKADASVKASVKTVPYGKAAKVNVTLTPKSATGKVTLKKGNKVLGTANAKNGKATITIKKKALKPGRHNLSVNYAGNATTKPANGKVTLKVTKATSKTKAKKKTKKVIAKKTRAKLAITIKTPAGVPANGRVTVTFKGKKVGTAKVNAKGKATVRIKKFATKGKKKLVIRYQATPTVKASKTTIKINVKKRK